MQLTPIHIREFPGVGIQRDTTDMPAGTLLEARNVHRRPLGGFSSPPPDHRLWNLGGLADRKAELSLTSDDKTACIKIINEGHVFIAFFDCVNDVNRGVFYAGTDPDALSVAAKPSLTIEGATLCVLWKNLQAELHWNGGPQYGILLMGNGCDDNLVYDPKLKQIRRMGDHIRPLAPEAFGADVHERQPSNATFTYGGILFQALEPRFDPVNEETYKRADGNNVRIDIVQVDIDYFRSELEGKGTWADPYEYTVWAPATLPTREQTVNFIKRDPNSQGILTATLVDDGGEDVTLFNGARLTGGVTAFDVSDTFRAPQVDVLTTYFRRDDRNLGFESGPSQIITAKEVGAKYLSVTVKKDTVHPEASQYDAIRIYLSAYTVTEQGQGWAYDGNTFNYSAGETVATDGFATRGYIAFKMALEVPNEDGTYLIAPSLLADGTELNANMKMPPPATQFVSAYGRIWMIGDLANPLRLSYTRVNDNEALFPENSGIEDFIDLEGSLTEDKATAIASYRGRLIAYTTTKAFLVPATFFSDGVNDAPVTAGALNQRCAINWLDGIQYYVGTDFNLYALQQPRDTDDASARPVSSLMSPKIENYLQDFGDITAGDRAHSQIDYLGKQWWIWLPMKEGNMKAFCFDFTDNELTGPFDSPAFSSSTTINQGDSRIIGCDEQDNLFVMDLNAALNRKQSFTGGSAETIYASTDAIPAPETEHGGQTVVLLPSDRYLLNADLISYQTGWEYAREPGDLIGWYRIQWSTIKGSAGLVTVTIEDDDDNQRSYEYGEVFGRRNPHSQVVMFSGRAVRITLTIATSQNFAIRDASLWYKKHKGSH